MKALKLTAATAVVCSAFAAGIYASSIKSESQQALDTCAKENNVYSCKWVAVPAQEPRVVYKTADLLPPPVDME